MTVDWSTQPTTTTSNAVTIAPSTSTLQDYTLNVTQLVQDMVMNPSTSHGFMIKLDTESTYRSLIFASSDHPEAAQRPKLVVQYTLPQSIEATTRPSGISLSPNPAIQEVAIKLNGAFKTGAFITVIDAFGRVVRSSTFKGDAAVLEVANLAAGLYSVNIFAHTGESYTDRLMVQ